MQRKSRACLPLPQHSETEVLKDSLLWAFSIWKSPSYRHLDCNETPFSPHFEHCLSFNSWAACTPSLPTLQRLWQLGSQGYHTGIPAALQYPRKQKRDCCLSFLLGARTLDPHHSEVGTAVDQEAGLAHRPLLTNVPFCYAS